MKQDEKTLWAFWIPLGVLVTCWTVNPFLKKKASVDMSANEYLLINNVIVLGLIAVYAIYLICRGNIDWKNYSNMGGSQVSYAMFAGITTVISAVILIYLIQHHSVGKLMPHIQPIVIAATVMVGWLVFREKFHYEQAIGVALIMGGLVVMNLVK